MNTTDMNDSTDQNDDVELHTYQDDLTTDDSVSDPIMNEESDDPTQDLGIDPEEFKNELDKYDTDSTSDDRREDIEDRDEDEDMGRA